MNHRGSIGTALLAALALTPGCGPAQISRGNREIVESLATAVSARNADWLDENTEQVEARMAAGGLPETDERAFREIIDRAKAAGSLREDFTPEVAAARLPIATLHGEHDTVVLPAMSDLIASVRPDTTAVRLPGVGHVPWLESPDAFQAALARLVTPAGP